MGSIEKRGENTWRVGFRRSVADGRGWVRKTLSFPADMSEVEQRKACEVELARLVVQEADGRHAMTAPSQADVLSLIEKYHITPEDAAKLGAGKASDRWKLTVQELYDRWMEIYCIPNLAPTTAKTYRSLMETRVLPLIGNRQITSLTAFDAQQLIASLRQAPRRTTAIDPEQRKRRADRQRQPQPPKPLSARTVQHHFTTISGMFDMGVSWKLIPENPFKDVKRPTARRKKLKVLDDERAVELLRCLAKEDSLSFRAAVMLALTCGLRLGEVGALCWDDVDWKRCTIDISRGLNYVPELGNYTSDPKTEEGSRTIDLPAGMMTLLQETKAYQDDIAAKLGDRWRGQGRIVCGWDGTPQHHDTPSKQFRKFADKHGFEGIRFHDLRHPYVKHTTKIFSLRLMDFQAQAYPDARRKTRGACQLLRVGQSRSPVRPLCNRKRFSCLPPQSKMSWILYAISMRLSGYTSTRSISSSASSVVSVSASKIALDASLRLSCRACSSCFCFACANTAA